MLNLELHKQANKKYYNNNKIKHKLCQRNSYLKSTYGINLIEYNNLFVKQSGCCAMCGKHQSEFKKRLAVDHSHTTNKVRSLLCNFCNTGLGIYELYKERYENYLTKFDI